MSKNTLEIRINGFEDSWEQRKISDMFKVTRGYVLAATLTEENKSEEMPYPVYSSQTKDKGLMGYYKDFEQICQMEKFIYFLMIIYCV